MKSYSISVLSGDGGGVRETGVGEGETVSQGNTISRSSNIASEDKFIRCSPLTLATFLLCAKGIL